MTPDPESTTPRPRRGWPPEVQAQVDEYIARLSEGGDLWQRARDRERARYEELEEDIRRARDGVAYWEAEHRRLTRGGPVRRMLRALFT
ncbi:hypothetical protein [Cellulosimicrobium cellulans]|uniref:hypothetical protein n=1 Tax=Cellulosimicrobium cellulans TaxID=1710 RepID=UPI00130EAD31|nr:hypothetical protein [Cellulosimicrobium cellulans]